MTLTLRILASLVAAVGLDPDNTLDESINLDGLEDVSVRKRVLSASAADEAVAFTNCIAAIIVTKDTSFQLRLAGGETLMPNLRAFIVWGHTESGTACLTTSFLLTGNGSNEANLEIWLIEKPIP